MVAVGHRTCVQYNDDPKHLGKQKVSRNLARLPPLAMRWPTDCCPGRRKGSASIRPPKVVMARGRVGMKRGSDSSSAVQISWHTTNDATGGTKGIGKFPTGAIVKIGRDIDNDVVLSDPKVSRKHAHLAIGESGIVVTDLRTRNGSLIDGRRRLGATPWRPGQLLQIGDHIFEFQFLFRTGDATAPVTIPARSSVPEAYPRNVETNHPSLTPSEGEPSAKVPPLPEVSKAADLQPPNGATTEAGQESPVEASEAERPVAKPANSPETSLVSTELQDEDHSIEQPHQNRQPRFIDRLAEGTEAAEQSPPDDTITEVEPPEVSAQPFRIDLGRIPSVPTEPNVLSAIQPPGPDHPSEPAAKIELVERAAAPASAPRGATEAKPVGGGQEANGINGPHRTENRRPWRHRLVVGSIAVAL